ncbi:MAG: penicillin-binding protein 2 [Arcanobacterium sp.]|nr:penicillin-binding protein 2 [Arcanobacterium sp.]
MNTEHSNRRRSSSPRKENNEETSSTRLQKNGKLATMDRRIKPIVSIVLVMALLLSLQLFRLQVLQADKLAQVARDLRTRSYVHEADRGEILDANGVVLATSVPRYNLRVDQRALTDFVLKNENGEIEGVGAAAAAKILAPILQRDQAELGGEMLGGEQKNQYKLLKRGLTPEDWLEIKALNIHGVFGERYIQRVYPNGTLAGNIIGYVGKTEDSDLMSGRSGIEQYFDEALQGTPGKETVEVGPDGTIFPQAQREEIAPINGKDVRLTIDLEIQRVAEEQIKEAVRRTGANWGAAAIIEVGTGRVLALVDNNEFDPAKIAEKPPKSFTNLAIGGLVEPGSTGKIVTFATAMEEAGTKWDDLYTDPYRITMPNGQSFKDAVPHPTAVMTAAGILAMSYNTGTIQIGDKVEPQTRFEYLQKFGFGAKTGIELPAEAAGVLRSPDKWDDRTHYTTMFGQSYSVTALQLAQMGSVIGNKGVLVPPTIYEATIDNDGLVTPNEPKESRQVVTPETTTELLRIMQGITEDRGLAPKARIDGYNVAGKTGTAEVFSPNGQRTGVIGTFVAAIPAEDPKIAIGAVIVNNNYTGGYELSDLISQAGGTAMRQLSVPPSKVAQVKLPWYESELP